VTAVNPAFWLQESNNNDYDDDDDDELYWIHLYVRILSWPRVLHV